MTDTASTYDNRCVAVVMSVYAKDKPEYLIKSLDSVIACNTVRCVWLGVDGPIPSSIRSILDIYRSISPILKIVEFPLNRGLACVLNELITSTLKDPDIEYVARMDSDDISMPDRFCRQVEFLSSNKGIDVLGTNAWIIDEFDTSSRVYKKPSSDKILKRRLPLDSPFIHPTVMFRANLLRGGYRYPTHTIKFEDVAMWSNIALAGCKFANLDLPLLFFRYTKQTMYRRTGLSKVFSDSRIRLNYISKYMPWRLDIAILVILVAAAKTLLPPSILVGLFNFRIKMP
jgi:hypothetical protein